MSNLMFAHEVGMVVEECCNCGMQFAITRQFQNRVKRTHENFYCPAGHGQHYPAKSKEEKLKDQVANLERRVEQERKRKEWAEQDAQLAKNRERAQKAAKTRLKNDIARGKCPCCKKTFKHLAKHMAAKHPEFDAKGEEEV